MPSGNLSRPMGGRTAHTPWGGSKVQRTISVTNEAWELWTAAAQKADINRSELFEVIARNVGKLNVLELRVGLLSRLMEVDLDDDDED